MVATALPMRPALQAAALLCVCFLWVCGAAAAVEAEAPRASEATHSGSSGNTDLPSDPAATAPSIDPSALAPSDLRFAVPFQVAVAQGLAVDTQREQQHHQLFVKSVQTQQLAPSAAAPASQQQDQTCATGLELPPGPVRVSDRLVRADGIEISRQPLEDALRGPVGSVALLPLFTPSAHGAATPAGATEPQLSAFVRIEIIHPTALEFEPTTDTRKREIAAWRALVAQHKQEQLEREAAAALDTTAREQEERDRLAALENAQLERDAREKHERFEYERLSLTPHDRVGSKRSQGLEFRYAVEFARDGPIGINWDLHTTDKTVVSYLEPTLRAAALGVIAPRDQLIQINDVNTTDMGPHDVVSVYVQAPLPRTLVFLCAATKSERSPGAAEEGAPLATNVPQNWTLAFEEPAVLRGWHVRLHLVNWSAMPELDAATNATPAMVLVQADPLLACHPLTALPPITAGAAARQGGADPLLDAPVRELGGAMVVSYRGGCSFVDKAEHVRHAGGRALLVLNNVKGEGRFPPGVPATGNVPLPVTMISKLDGEIVLPVMEYETADPSQLPVLDVDPTPLTNDELTRARNVRLAARSLTFWYLNASLPVPKGVKPSQQPAAPTTVATLAFDVLPALFGNKIPAMPLRVVMAYPQDTACHHMGLAIHATRAVVLVKRGKCSFGAKMRAVQDVGGAGMLLWNTDESLIPLMTEKKEIAGLRIWGATISLSNGSKIAEVLERNKNLPSLINIAERAP